MSKQRHSMADKMTAENNTQKLQPSAKSWPRCAHQRRVWGRVRWGVPPHSLVDVDVMDKQGDEVAEEKMELEQHVAIHG